MTQSTKQLIWITQIYINGATPHVRAFRTKRSATDHIMKWFDPNALVLRYDKDMTVKDVLREYLESGDPDMGASLNSGFNRYPQDAYSFQWFSIDAQELAS